MAIFSDVGFKDEIIKKWFKIGGYTILSLTLLLLIMAALLLVPGVQRSVANNYLESLARELGATISIDKVYFGTDKELTIENLYVTDQHGDTLVFCEHIDAGVSFFDLVSRSIWLNDIHITGGLFDLKTYEGEERNNLQFIVDHFTDSTKKSEPWQYSVNDVIVSDFEFRFTDQSKTRKDTGIDWAHLRLRDINLEAANICNQLDTIEGEILELRAMDHSGFVLSDLASSVLISPRFLRMDSLKIATPDTRIKTDLNFKYDQYVSFRNFVEDVKMQATFKRTKLQMADLAYFVPQLWGMKKEVAISGRVRGSVDRLKARGLKLETIEHTVFRGDVDLEGLPDINETFIHMKVHEFITSAKRLEKIPVPPYGPDDHLVLDPIVHKFGEVDIEGTFTGFINDFVAYGRADTRIGSLTSDMEIQRDSTGTFNSYSGYLATTGLDLGVLLDRRESVGRVTSRLNIVGSGLKPESMKMDVDGTVASAVIRGYEYNGVAVNGKLDNEVFQGKLTINDENIECDAAGAVDFSEKRIKYKFLSNIYKAKLAKLNLIKGSGLKTRFSSTVIVDLEGSSIDDMTGKVQFAESFYKDKISQFEIEDMTLLSSIDQDSTRHIEVKSDIADIGIDGRFTFTEMAKSFDYLLSKHVPKYRAEEYGEIAEEDLRFHISVNNSALITKLLTPGIAWSANTSLSGSFNARNAYLSVSGNIPDVEIGGTKFHQLQLEARTIDEIMYLNVNGERWNYNDSLWLEHLVIHSTLAHDTLITDFAFANDVGPNRKGLINSKIAFLGDNSISGQLMDSYLEFDEKWVFDNGNDIYVDTNKLIIKHLHVSAPGRHFKLDGTMSHSVDDTLAIDINNFDLENLTSFFEGKLRPEGRLDGLVHIRDPYDHKMFTGHVEMDDFVINGSRLGDGNFIAGWLEDKQALSSDGQFELDSFTILNVGGKYLPRKRGDSIDYVVALNGTPISVVNPFIEEFVSETSGELSGYLTFRGGVDEPVMDGQINLKDVAGRVNYLNTYYKIQPSQVVVKKDMFYVNNAELLDEDGNTASCNATISHENFKDFNMNIGLYTDNFLFMNTDETHNPTYYGTAYLKGFVDVSGYADRLDLMAEVKTNKGSILSIPLDNSEEVEENSLVTFINRADTTNVKEEVDLSNIDMNFVFDITKDAEVRLIFDEQVGDVISVKGHSDKFKMAVNTNGKFEMRGKYIIEEGDYLFTLSNVINKKFDVGKGGTIQWSGDPYEARIDLSAIYKLRASPYDIMTGLDSLAREPYKKRQPVWCYLKMKNKLMNPDISFDIKMPSADQTVKDRLNGIVYVSESEPNVQEMNKQVFALLILNRFIAPQQGADDAQRAGFGSTTSSELLSNQLSNWLSQISDDFDIGFNYRPGDEISNDEVQVALSTQILNDRVILDGNVGYSEDRLTHNGSVVGEFSVEYKITENFRARAFNEANTNAYLDNQGLYTQGVGIYYQEEFDTWRELWKKFFGTFRRKKKESKKARKEG